MRANHSGPVDRRGAGASLRRFNMSEPLKEDDIVVMVPHGTAKHVRVEESKSKEGAPHIVVRVSNKRKYDVSVPILGVIVK
jgi:hypothetical protein